MESFSMESLKSIMIPLVVIVIVAVTALTVLALRERIFFKMGVRNLGRRPAQTLLTFMGLMLAAMIFSASFSTGDTLTQSIRNLGVEAYGEVDIRIESRATDVYGTLGYFDQAHVEPITQGLKDEVAVEGIAPAIGENVPVMSPETNLYEPVTTLFGINELYTTDFEPLRDRGGGELELRDLADDQIYISEELAEQLGVDEGQTVSLFFGRQMVPYEIKGIYTGGRNPVITEGSEFAKTDLTIVMPLERVQGALNREGEINAILITLKGGVVEGARYSDAVMETIESNLNLEEMGLTADPLKKENLDAADENGAAFTTIFFVMGSFSIIAGVLLIFLIFVMLAAERKQELGMARAVGTQRGHVIRMFTFEGTPYALVSSAVGSGLGLLFGWAMVQFLTPLFEEQGFPLAYKFTPSSIIISYCLGVILTLLVVIVSAWRVSQLNIVRAIRDIPEPPKTGRGKIRDLILPLIICFVGIAALLGGLQETQFVSYALGSSLLIIGVPLLVRRFRLSDRIAFTFIGIALLGFWLTPAKYHPMAEEATTGPEMFILSGVMMVAGGVWLIIYNSDILLAFILALFGRIRALAPILKMAVTYPMSARFRTGMALAMFALIIFTLVVMSSMNASFASLINDTDRLSGGFDIYSTASRTSPVDDIESAIEESGIGIENFKAVASYSLILVEMRQAGKDQEWEQVPIAGMDSSYLENTTFQFEMTTESYQSKNPSDIWEALENDPSLAVINAMMIPSDDGGAMGPVPDLKIGEGEINLQSKKLPDDIFIEIKYPGSEEIRELQVIGVIDQMGFYAPLVATSAQTLNDLAGTVLSPAMYWFRVAPEANDRVSELARDLESNFLEYGFDTTVVQEQVNVITQMNQMFMNLMMVFLGLGLIVGITALGVIAARTVVERWHQIGMLRAIGFRQGMVQFTFLLESSFIAILGIIIGVALGVSLTYQIVPEAGVEGLETVIPWLRIGLIVIVAYLASLTTTFIPAYRASRIYPAEALRYE
ncbi:MAG: FtsX-like permease family protein [Dehalococcoidia bacterium]